MKNLKRSVFALSLLIALLCAGCTDSDGAINALENEGFTEIRITGYNVFACSEDDFYHTSFSAKNSNGKTVTGTVCAGMFLKGSTIRY